MKKRVVVIADLHSGSLVGLTPPAWQTPYKPKTESKMNKWAKIQRDMWGWYANTIELLKPIHVLIVNGDAVDGPGKRSGGTEQLTTDMTEQAEIASYCIKQAQSRPTKTVMLYGTDYHVGLDGTDVENFIADEVKAEKIGSQEWIEVNGRILNCKHHIGSSGIPHGRFTAIAREALWAQLWHDAGRTPNSDIIIRSHTHFHVYGGGADRPLAMITPALQGAGSKYGSRRCSGLVHVGLVQFDFETDGRYSWRSHIANLESHKAQALRL